MRAAMETDGGAAQDGAAMAALQAELAALQQRHAAVCAEAARLRRERESLMDMSSALRAQIVRQRAGEDAWVAEAPRWAAPAPQPAPGRAPPPPLRGGTIFPAPPPVVAQAVAVQARPVGRSGASQRATVSQDEARARAAALTLRKAAQVRGPAPVDWVAEARRAAAAEVR